MKQTELKKLTGFLFEIGNLRKVLRAHQQVLLSYDLTDTIASHSFRVTFIGYFLAKELGADADKVLKMCLAHDIEESRSMDHHWVSKKYVKIYDDEIRKDQLRGLPHAGEMIKLSKEYKDRKTLEAKVAKDADLLDQVFLLREYEWQGNSEARDWLRGDRGAKSSGKLGQSNQEKLMFTPLAKKIAREVKRQRPSEWWRDSWTSQRR
jgi:putative hydrolase of HD superfamily